VNRLRREQPWSFFIERDRPLTHLFAVRFGDLARIRVRGRDDVQVEFRNGETARLEGGSNDVGAQVTVLDPHHGRNTLEWKRIRSVEFRETPARLAKKLGEPLYGVVKSRHLDFTGRIQWDHDECLTIDQLDGDTDDGKVSLEFGDIASIRKYRRGALVTLRSGTELYLRGSNDVDRGNRGVLVKMRGLGSVKIGWNDFDEVRFLPAPNSGRGYAEYAPGRELAGQVVAGGQRYTGQIVFDLDESWDFELLHGKNGSTEYLIPFREIARIRPRGIRQSDVELRNGLVIELEESQDVSRKNDGLLVFTDRQQPKYIAWRDVDEVVFH
jgi:hypothetical protein